MFASGLLMTVCLLAQEKAEQGGPQLDPKLADYYTRQVAFLKDADSYSVEVRLDWKTQGAGDETSGVNLYRFAYRKPGRFRIEIRPGGEGADAPTEPSLLVVSDGETVTTYYPERKLVAERPLIDLKDALADNAIVAMSLDGSLLDTLLRSDLVEIVRSHANQSRHEGQEAVDGKTLDRFSLRWRADDEQLWFGPAEEPLPRKLVRTVKVAVPGKPPFQLVTTATLTWKLGAELPDSTFRFDRPDDARKVPDIYAALVRGTAADLIGQKAPDLDLPRAGGPQRVALAGHRGKEIVVLDFWASWCAPCLESMPQMARIAEAYRDKGVVFYTVNVGEDEADVTRFLKSGKMALPVGLDPHGDAAERFGITAIPAVLVVGKDGTVQAEYSGSGDALEQALTRDLDTLRSGKTLAPAAAKPSKD